MRVDAGARARWRALRLRSQGRRSGGEETTRVINMGPSQCLHSSVDDALFLSFLFSILRRAGPPILTFVRSLGRSERSWNSRSKELSSDEEQD